MATVPSMRVTGAIANTVTNTLGSTTLYTAPANSFAQVTINVSAAAALGTLEVHVGGVRVGTIAGFTTSMNSTTVFGSGVFSALGGTSNAANPLSQICSASFTVGPGQAVAVVHNAGVSVTKSITGVQFGP